MRTHLLTGKTYSQIINLSKTLKPEFIVMSTHGASGVKDIQKYFLGSNAYRVVNHAKCPVLTIRKARKNPSFKTILLPVDVTSKSEQKVERAIRWAKAFGSTIHAISISELRDAVVLKGRRPEAKLDKIIKRIEAAGVPCVAAAFHNRPIADTVLNYAEVKKMDVIFIMTHRESGSQTKFLGSTARKIVENSVVPVLSVHPKDKLVQQAR
jgi:nucleotide-binding universal stress UspA family protein